MGGASSRPPTGATRPTTDKVREAVFNALASLDVVIDARVADLYAGSGALGLEALSRGATHCTFVERNRAAVGAIRAEHRRPGRPRPGAHVVADGVAAAAKLDVDVAFADPPYGFDDWPRLLRESGPSSSWRRPRRPSRHQSSGSRGGSSATAARG